MGMQKRRQKTYLETFTVMNENLKEESKNHNNPFFGEYKTPHETVPFNLIKTEHYEEAFMEGIRRDDEEIEKLINNP